MAKIHELSSILSDQISAGEVIERPASVVKELVENSIDAGSSRIDIEINESGLKGIKIVDNGSGIAPDQVKLAFKRFATSKISSQNDLFDIHSLGFRGEALPSIAAISNVAMKTSDGKQHGSEIQVYGGEIIKQMPAELRRGTSVEVKDLFFNTPHRLRYLKSASTELSKITDVVNRLALSHPEIAISLTHNGKEILRTSGRNNLLQVIAGIYGNQTMKKMLEIKNENENFSLTGYTSLPDLTRASRKYISIIINGRFVKDFTLNHAIIEGYGSKLMVGRFPISVIKIEMSPSLIDVNVHPTKQEIRLSNSRELSDFIAKSIYSFLAKENLIPDAMENKTLKRGVSEHNSMEVALNFDDLDDQKSQTRNIVIEKSQDSLKFKKTTKIENNNFQSHQPAVILTKNDLNSEAVIDFKNRYSRERVEGPFGTEKAKENHDNVRFPKLRYIGQVHGTYLIAESEDGMYIIDQHAAQERINYEQLRKQVGMIESDEQNLLVPIVLDYPASDALEIKNNFELLASVGINLESFGENSFVVRQHPTWFEKGQEEKTIREMIDWVLTNRKLSTAEYREKAAIMMSCKQAIKANHHLNEQQAKGLLENLQKCENPFNCPHGRPVLVHFNPSDLQTMFKRIQDPHDTNSWEF
ncbi:DNA mismatch repair protein MutL [Fructilactobacillus lindneri]|nr:DNA mismatch repair endonuclease MutL [Fructilactobacillus lindneri]ANZ58335.1 DNA mismatch repair protein MutL [Fructilactobacillus lindneri]ANZ59657.1 DNA mismatch repair protein MutL [Fructilactobacillus lindneri]POG98559.1 DNA mismatch repair protein MutL [Fructilactobacillus lindneri]POH03947.1 DNA mismatch repair protein MutL [Fructilactobacillus lindneri]POH04810.1 DNA mismatch repair protein MutL [Fructilactobacillus lindneri]